MPKITPRQYAQALYQALIESPEDVDAIIERFVNELVSRRELRYAKQIIAAYESIVKEAAGEKELEVVAARPLEESVKEKIQKVFGGKVTIIEKIDPSLIGGVQIKTKDTVIDASIKQQLQRLHNTLTA